MRLVFIQELSVVSDKRYVSSPLEMLSESAFEKCSERHALNNLTSNGQYGGHLAQRTFILLVSVH
jgi:hypothetical protein